MTKLYESSMENTGYVFVTRNNLTMHVKLPQKSSWKQRTCSNAVFSLQIKRNLSEIRTFKLLDVCLLLIHVLKLPISRLGIKKINNRESEPIQFKFFDCVNPRTSIKILPE